MPQTEVSSGLPAALLDSLDSALVVTDAEGGILLWNLAAERLYGYGRQEMRGANVLQLFVPDGRGHEAATIMNVVLARGAWTGEFTVQCGDGHQKRVRITNSRVLRGGRVVAIVGLAEEATARTQDADEPSTAGRLDLAAALAELDGLRTAMATRGTIEQAKGVVMASLGVDAATAFEVLCRKSQRSGRKLIDIAEDVVAGAAAGRAPVARRRAQSVR